MNEGLFHPIPIDVVFRNICVYFDCRTLCRLMRVSKTFLRSFVTDAAWQHVRARLLRKYPMWRESVFEACPWRVSGENDGEERDVKRARIGQGFAKPFLMPSGGTWFVVKRFLWAARSDHGIVNLCRMGRVKITKAVVEGLLLASMSAGFRAGAQVTQRDVNDDRMYWFYFTFKAADGKSVSYHVQKGKWWRYLIVSHRTKLYLAQVAVKGAFNTY